MLPCSCCQCPIARPRSLVLLSVVAAVCMRAGARSLHVRRAIVVTSSSRGQCSRRRIVNKFIRIRSARLDSGSSRQLEQQRLCCALKCLCHVVCQLSTSRRQLNKIDRQNYNFRQSIRQPLLRKPAWISQSTYTPKSKHRKSMQTSTMQLK
jgi:hypothetical protein